MIKGTLVSSMDYKRGKNVKVRRYSYRVKGQWYTVTAGSGFANTHKVTEYDDEGLDALLKMEDKSLSS